MWKKILIIGGCLLLAAVICFGTVVPWIYYDQYVQPLAETHEQTIKKHIDSFRKEYATVAHLIDWKPRGNRDAGQMLNERLPWSHNSETCRPACDLQLQQDLLERLRDNAWFDLIEAPGNTTPDPSWMAELKNYDVWDLYTAPQADLNGRGLMGYNTPAYKHLIAWSKIRLAAGITAARAREASDDIRHLAMLVHSQGTVVSSMVAVAILKTEASLLGRLKEIQHPAASSLPALSIEQVDALRRVCWASGFLFQPSTPEDILQELYGTDAYDLCRCAGISEGLVMSSPVPVSLRGHYLPERQKILKDIAKSQTDTCRLHTILSTPAKTYSEETERMARAASLLGPLWAKALAGTVYTLGGPSAFRHYEEKLQK